MNLNEFIIFAKKKLRDNYDERESENVIRILIEDITGIRKQDFNQFKHQVLLQQKLDTLLPALERLAQDEPLQYVIGYADFLDMRLKVNRQTLIPRPETEELADLTIRTLKPISEKKNLSILDVGTGSGCLAIALKNNLPELEVTAMDVSDETLSVASENARTYHCKINFLQMDFLDEKQWELLGMFDAIFSNPPYVSADEFPELMNRVKNFEPHQALIANHDDAFIFYKKIMLFSKKHLTSGGHLFLEINTSYASEIASFYEVDFDVSVLKDLQGNERMLLGVKKGASFSEK